MVNVLPHRPASTTQFAHPPTSILFPNNLTVSHNQVFVPVPSYASVAAPASTSVDSFCNFDHGNVVHAIPPNFSYPSSNYAMLPNNPLSSRQPHCSVYRVIQSHDIPPPNSSTGSSQWQSQTSIAYPALLFNARSLKNKLPDLHQLIYSSNEPRMTFISETWLSCSVTNSMLDPRHHFNIFRCDRPGRSGGGVCAMISLQYKCHERVFSDDDFSMVKHSGCEIVCIDVTIVSTKHRFIVVYRPPKGPSIKYVTLFLMIFDPPPVTNCHKSWTPLKVCHTSEQKVNKQISGEWRLPINNYNNYYILNNNKRPYWVFLINPEIPLQV